MTALDALNAARAAWERQDQQQQLDLEPDVLNRRPATEKQTHRRRLPLPLGAPVEGGQDLRPGRPERPVGTYPPRWAAQGVRRPPSPDRQEEAEE